MPDFMELPEEIEPSKESLELLSRAQEEMEKRGITAIPIWQAGENAGKLIAALAANELDVYKVCDRPCSTSGEQRKPKIMEMTCPYQGAI